MPKVYEVESGKTKKRGFVLYPSWRCPTCKVMRREPMARKCRFCKHLAEDRESEAKANGSQ